MDDRLSANSLFLVGKSMFLCVPVFVLDGTLRNVFGTLRNVFGHFQILSDPSKNLGTLKIKNVTPINVKKLAGIYGHLVQVSRCSILTAAIDLYPNCIFHCFNNNSIAFSFQYHHSVTMRALATSILKL